MTYSRVQHAGGAVATTLGSDITSGATTGTLAASTGWPDGSVGPFYLVIDPGLANEEKILCDTRSGLSLSSLTRGVDGTAASAHASGAVVRHCYTATEADEANVAVTKTVGAVTTKGDLLAATGTQALSREAVGADGTVHIADSGQPTGHRWAQIAAANITSGTITSTQIADATIATADLADSAVTSAKIADGTIATADLADSAVTSAKIADATIATADLADSAVTAAKLAAAPGVSEPLFHAGTFSGSTDGGGNAVIASGAAFTPRLVFVTPISPLTAVPFLTTLGPSAGQFTLKYTALSGSVSGISIAGHFVVFP